MRLAVVDLLLQRLVGAEQELLAGLAAAVEGALDEHAAEASGSRACPPYSRLKGTPWATAWSMIPVESSASRQTFASRARKSPPLIVSTNRRWTESPSLA